MNSTQGTRRQAHGVRQVVTAAASLLAAFGVQAAAPSTAPQVLLAITNSESMDGTTAGAIMVGSGGLASGYSSLNSSSSPLNYVIPTGFTPPVNTGSGGSAPYTATCLTNSSYKCDNSQSRLNMTKAAIKQVLTNYGSSINFGLYTYANSSGGAPSPSLYTTWVYYMSPSSSGFTYTNTSSSTTVANPCYNYGSASSNVNSACNSIATTTGTGVNSTTLSGSRYINIGATSDDPQINDVLYAGSSLPADLLTYGTVSPSNPYTYYSLNTYKTNIGGYSMGYSATAPNIGGWSTTPTNAGYVPFSPQVLYSERGFGYGGSQSATTGYATVAMNTDPASSTFLNALAPETNSTSSSEIKSFAGQSGIYALMNGAKTYLSGISHASCQPQYVVLLTDGLPTLDHSGNAWPPLGTTTANAYSLTATYNANGSFNTSNSQAVTDAVNAIAALNTAGIKVYVIGLGAGVDRTVNPQAAALLTAMAIAGGTTNYFPAGDSDSLNNAFLSIIDQIYAENSLSAPVAPISVSSGSALQYELTSMPNPVAGHVKAYPVSANGTVGTTAVWDAGALMTATNRTAALMGNKTDNTFALLANMDTAVWNLTPTTCVPNITTIIGYTIDPAYSGACSYIGTRQTAPAWYLGNFSTQNTGRYVGPPASALLTQRYPSYLAYARSNAGRTPMLMFTNDDGFLYALTASSGALRWGWSSRNLLAKMQNYSTFQGSNATDGNFSVVDALDTSSAWGSYVVGSLQGGAEHFVFKLDSTGAPYRMIYDAVVSGGTVAGDTAAATGNGPLRQPPVVAYIGNNAFMVYVITIGTTSTLYETNIATGATTSSALSFQVSSALTLDTTNRVWLGGANGSLWQIPLTTGNAASDAALIQRTGTLVNPATGSTLANPLYVGYIENYGAPHFYVMAASVLEVFFVGTNGWTPEWATTTSAGYRYTASTGVWATSPGANTLTTNSVSSDFPLSLGSALLVPVYVAGTGCSQGTGYYDYFGIDSGKFPTDPVLTQNGTQVTSNQSVGNGPAFTPSISFTSTGVVINDGAQLCTSNCGQQNMQNSYPVTPFSWRQH